MTLPPAHLADLPQLLDPLPSETPPPPRPVARRPRFLRLRKSIAIIAIAMGLSVSLVVTTPQTAEALILGPAAAPVLGAVAASTAPVWGPVAVAAGIGVLAVGAIFVIAAHENGVFEYPWEAGNPFFDNIFDVNAGPAGGETLGGLRWSGEVRTTESGGAVILTPILTGKVNRDGNHYVAAKSRVFCRSKDDGSIRVDENPAAAAGFQVVGQDGKQWSTSNPEFQCKQALYWEPVGLSLVAAGAGYKFTENSLHWRSPSWENKTPEWETTVDCTKGDGVVHQIKERVSALLGKIPQPSCASKGLGRARKSVTNLTDGGTLTPAPPLIDLEVGDTRYTECDPLFNPTPCKTEVHIDGFPCIVGSRACMDWAGLFKKNPGRVECFFGTRKVDVSLCFPLEDAYVPGGSVATEANTDGDPNTRDDPRTIPGWWPKEVGPEGVPVQDPDWEDDWAPDYPKPDPDPDPDVDLDLVTPTNPEPDPSSSPTPSPNPSNPTDPNPEPSNPTNPEPEPPVFPNPDGGKDDACGYTWAWNPFSWVGKQLECAFVPKTDIKDRVTKTRDVILGKPPIVWLSPAGIQGPGNSGCPNWVVTVGSFSKNVVCDSAFIDALVGIRTPLFNLVAAAMMWPLIRGIWYACIPILRVAPSSGGK